MSHIRSQWQAVALVLTLSLALSASVNADKRDGAVFVMTNQPSGNAVMLFDRAGNGALTLVQTAATGGLGGTGNGVGPLDPLGSQNSLVATGDGSRLLAVNAGSNDVSVLGVGDQTLTVLSRVSSGGQFPNSIAVSGNLVYVLNARGTPNVAGFRLSGAGVLSPLAGSVRALPGGAGSIPHDVVFSHDGSRLVVSEEGTRQLDVFEIGDDGLIAGVTTTPSAGAGPFALGFGRGNVLLNAEAGSAALSSYRLTDANTLVAVDPTVENGQAATCWIAQTRQGLTFVSNTARGTISSYRLSPFGALKLNDAVAATLDAGGAPIDLALSSDNRFLHVVDSARGRVLVFRVHGNNLSAAGGVSGLPQTVQGIIAQ